jgi:hypothetical protein
MALNRPVRNLVVAQHHKQDKPQILPNQKNNSRRRPQKLMYIATPPQQHTRKGFSDKNEPFLRPENIYIRLGCLTARNTPKR